MKRLLLLLVSLISSCPTSIFGFQDGCYGEGLGGNIDSARVADSAEDFSMDLFYRVFVEKKSASNQQTKSFVISPYSVWSVLILAYLGSAGETAAEIERVLRVTNKNEAFYGSRFMKRALASYRGTTFASLNKGYFDPSLQVSPCPKIHQIEELNFNQPGQAASKINQEVSDVTAGKIKNLFGPSDLANAVFVLLNAIYFKGTWLNQFNPKATNPRTFHDQYGRAFKKKIPMMVTEGAFKYADISALGAQVLELPYEKSNVSMVLILPHLTAGVGDNFELVLRRIPFRDATHNAVNVILNAMTMKKVYVTMPKFKIKTRIFGELKKVLEDMGTRTMFTSLADFSLFSSVKPLFVSKAIQEAVIEVNEEGTVAAAATGLIGTRSGSRRQITFTADRPFIFLLRDMSQGVTLFSGVFMGPEDNSQ